MEGFAEDIRRSLGESAKGISDIFTMVVAQQKRDYELAENALSNIEALKKNISIYGEKEVTDGANNLVKELSASIAQNGKLDYAKLGQLRKKVIEISDLKRGYDVFEKQFDKYVQFGAATKDKLVSYEKFYKDLIGLARDKELMKNPSDLAYRMGQVYDDNYDFVAAGASTIKSVLPTESVTGVIKKKDGSEETYKGKVFSGVTIDPTTGREVIPENVTVIDPATGQSVQVPFYQNLAQKMKQRDPEYFERFRTQQSKTNPMAANLTDEDIARSAFSIMPKSEITPISVKGQREVQSEENTLKIQETKMKYLPEEIKLDLQSKRLQIQKLNQDIENGKLTQSYLQGLSNTPENLGIYTSNGSAEWNLPKPVDMNMPMANGKVQKFKISQTKFENGVWKVVGNRYLKSAEGKVTTEMLNDNMEEIVISKGTLNKSKAGVAFMGAINPLIIQRPSRGKVNVWSTAYNTFMKAASGKLPSQQGVAQADPRVAKSIANLKALLSSGQITQADYNNKLAIINGE